MHIFRFEHVRSICEHKAYREGGESLTGHGTFTACPNKKITPNFGLNGRPPREQMMPHERCAVTIKQFSQWIGRDYSCKDTDARCEGYNYCDYCPDSDDFTIPEGWEVVEYQVSDASEGIDWRKDNDQIVFNPAFARRIGTVDVEYLEARAGMKLVADSPW